MRPILMLLPLTLAGCAMNDELGPARGLPTIALVNGAGASTGAVQVEPRSGGANLRIAVQGLPPGEHGLHLHAFGRCDPPGFQSAGDHWNPEGRRHGHLNPQGPHLGDLPNLTVSANGHGAINFRIAGLIGDADGTALVVHASPDDYQTDPSGNSGDRIACAVVARPRP